MTYSDMIALRLAATRKQFAVVTATARSGSTLLCQELISGGIGHPTEHFQQLPTVEELVEIVAETKGPWFATKILSDQAEGIYEHFGVRHLDEIFPAKTHWIHCARLDRVAQAVSLARAIHTDEWHRYPDSMPTVEPAITVEEIAAGVMQLTANERRWAEFYRGRRPTIVIYEDHLAHRGRVVEALAADLGVEWWENQPPVTIPMADHYSDLAAESFVDWLRSQRLASDLDPAAPAL